MIGWRYGHVVTVCREICLCHGRHASNRVIKAPPVTSKAERAAAVVLASSGKPRFDNNKQLKLMPSPNIGKSKYSITLGSRAR